MKHLNCNMIKGYLFIIIAFFVFVTLFYIGSGEQLYYREPSKEMSHMEGDTVTENISKEFTLQYQFISYIEMLHSIKIKFATWNRTDIEDLQIVLTNLTKNVVLLDKKIKGDEIKDNEEIEIILPEIEFDNIREDKLCIQILSDTEEGKVAPWINSTSNINNSQLYYNEILVDGDLCIELTGKNTVWLGKVFWKMVLVLLLILLIFIIWDAHKFRKNKFSLIFSIYETKNKYGFLMKQLVNRDFKTKYKKSIFGILWSFMNPLIMMTIQYVVFSKIFTNDIFCYPIYLLSGYTIFNFFCESVNQGIESIVNNASLITKVYVPKYIYPFTRVCSSAINLLITMILLLVMCIVMNIPFTRAMLLLPFPIICIFLFTMGIALLLTSLMVFFRDIKFLWGAFSLAWMYATPIFYPINIIPEHFSFIIYMNPISCILQLFRFILIEGRAGEPKLYALCVFYSLTSLFIGSLVFKKTQDKFILYI